MDWSPLRRLIETNQSFLITSHVRPDADALGAELGLRAILLAFGRDVIVVNASAPPANLHFLNPDGVIRKLNGGITRSEIPAVDVVAIVDTSAWQQLGTMSDYIKSIPAQRVIIDHHVSSDDLNAIEFRDVSSAATGELICDAADFLGVTFDAHTASALYAAIATDTGWFRFPSTRPQTMRAAARLMELGAEPHGIYNQVHEQSSPSRVQLSGRVLGRIQVDAGGRLAWVYVDAVDLAETGAVPSDTESIVNQCLTIAGTEAAFIAVELQTGQIKFSLRCRPPHDVAAVAAGFGGGGHRLASGATLSGPLSAAIQSVHTALVGMLEQHPVEASSSPVSGSDPTTAGTRTDDAGALA